MERRPRPDEYPSPGRNFSGVGTLNHCRKAHPRLECTAQSGPCRRAVCGKARTESPGYGPVAEGRPVGLRTRRLPCCGLGLGWCLFITGFFLAAIPWYIGAFVLICVRVHDQREKPGYVACTIAAVVAALAILLGVTKGTHAW